jgi:hypothetical protein
MFINHRYFNKPKAKCEFLVAALFLFYTSQEINLRSDAYLSKTRNIPEHCIQWR